MSYICALVAGAILTINARIWPALPAWFDISSREAHKAAKKLVKTRGLAVCKTLAESHYSTTPRLLLGRHRIVELDGRLDGARRPRDPGRPLTPLSLAYLPDDVDAP